jgi:GGDEF domain-containing protein
LGRRYQLSLSIGIVASDPAPAPDLQQLLEQADAQMYEDKQKRRGSGDAWRAANGAKAAQAG